LEVIASLFHTLGSAEKATLGIRHPSAFDLRSQRLKVHFNNLVSCFQNVDVSEKHNPSIREQSFSMGETRAEGIELGYKILVHVETGIKYITTFKLGCDIEY